MKIGRGEIEAECRVFARHLLGYDADAYIINKYAAAHETSQLFSTTTRFDGVLVAIAGKHPALTKAADSYARLFVPNSLLRKKLILLLALLETSAPSCDLIDGEGGSSRIALACRLFVRGVTFGASALVGAFIFLPTQLFLSSAHRNKE